MWYLIIKDGKVYFGKNKNKKQKKGMAFFETEKELLIKLNELVLENKFIKTIRSDVN